MILRQSSSIAVEAFAVGVEDAEGGAGNRGGAGGGGDGGGMGEKVALRHSFFILLSISATSDYKQSLQFQSLNEEKRNIKLEVIRGGRRFEVSIFDIVVGDVIPLKIGDQVPADGVLIVGHSLAIDESSMTGESKIVGILTFFSVAAAKTRNSHMPLLQVHKDQKDPFLMSGCKVADGYGNMLVTGVGLNTEWGLLMASISEDNGEETPLQVRLNGVATFIGMVGLSVAFVVLVVLVVRYFTGHTKNADGSVQFQPGKTRVGTALNGTVKIITIAVTIVVVAVPEGLPLAVTLTLAYSMRKMMMDKALALMHVTSLRQVNLQVRRLSACETMGSATTICSDKTGTLTLNQMTVVKAFAGGKMLEAPDKADLLSPRASSLLTEGIAQNTTGSVYVSEDGQVEVTGSPTEKAILHWGLKLGMRFEDLRSQSSVVQVFPFNSEKKRGGVAIQLSESDIHIHWKGAAELVLDSCTQYLDQDGSVQQINPDKMNEFKHVIEKMAGESLRCVAFGFRQCDVKKAPVSMEQRKQWVIPDDGLVLLAIVGIKDPCRPGVKEAVNLCRNAGVKVRMVTGDNIQTATAIALECGILDSRELQPGAIIEGRAFRVLSETERQHVARDLSVMARSSPNDKLLLVQALRKQGNVVAVTGDGTNDAPALHEADIGLAMGIQGTEVAKESADIIILDDNFSSVVKVVRWGRSVYANIQKFIQFQLTVNVAALIINVVASISAGDVPLKAVQLLWVNLIMDTLGALALATEPPTDDLMQRRPVGRRDPLITNVMWRNVIVQAIYQVTVLLVLNFDGIRLLHLSNQTKADAEDVKNTFIFNAFVMCQVFNEFNARKPDKLNIFSGVTKNHLFMGIIGATALIVEFLGKFASTVRLSWQLWIASIALGFVSWPLALLSKLLPVPETPFAEYFRRMYCCKPGGKGGERCGERQQSTEAQDGSAR
ncbi:Calcium-transporting ATPase 10 plasma membrane-type [Nymphaea thermarum]|nr:Calcium-transporting ATPase 10 plasma membrane-type [Nymphaea thermarum]